MKACFLQSLLNADARTAPRVSITVNGPVTINAAPSEDEYEDEDDEDYDEEDEALLAGTVLDKILTSAERLKDTAERLKQGFQADFDMGARHKDDGDQLEVSFSFEGAIPLPGPDPDQGDVLKAISTAQDELMHRINATFAEARAKACERFPVKKA